MLRTNVTCFEWLLILHDYALVCWQDDWVPQYTHRHASVSMLNFRGDRPSVCFRTSSEQTKDGQPCGTIKARGAGGHEITVWNLDHCAIVLGSAGDGKMNETRNCLEANFDPTAVILGDRFATVSAVADNDAYFRFKEEVRKDQEKDGASEGTVEVSRKMLRHNPFFFCEIIACKIMLSEMFKRSRNSRKTSQTESANSNTKFGHDNERWSFTAQTRVSYFVFSFKISYALCAHTVPKCPSNQCYFTTLLQGFQSFSTECWGSVQCLTALRWRRRRKQRLGIHWLCTA